MMRTTALSNETRRHHAARAALVAPVNFGPTQRHMKIDVELGHPGHVVKTKQPMLMWRGDALGVIICASRARNTFSEPDLEEHVAFSHLPATQWMAHQGPEYLQRVAA